MRANIAVESHTSYVAFLGHFFDFDYALNYSLLFQTSGSKSCTVYFIAIIKG